MIVPNKDVLLLLEEQLLLATDWVRYEIDHWSAECVILSNCYVKFTATSLILHGTSFLLEILGPVLYQYQYVDFDRINFSTWFTQREASVSLHLLSSQVEITPLLSDLRIA